MARINLSLVFEQPDAATLHPMMVDPNGWTVDDWFNDGFVGWDAATCTYFLQLAPEGLDVPAWQFGRQPGDLKTPFEVQAILGTLFHVNGVKAFPHKPAVMLHLLAERDRMFTDEPAALAALRNLDESFVLASGTKEPSKEWLQWIAAHARMGVKAREVGAVSAA
ncbi:hypothetical protein [Burkholderia vietnamiensis]|uniref:hypothetical protein n=1 Tax=Burkholderia vietnamiensis TaxID=60552 RepID=UPI001CF1E203|nr:hypothetical protein [Burkholderia vietnamiensis]MCA8448990.1 hypothetical protein [Burkholderia vietnamiensis]